jgi:hypothetical protein
MIEDLEPWDVKISIFFGSLTTKAQITSLKPKTKYVIQSFAMTLDGIRSLIDMGTVETQEAVVESEANDDQDEGGNRNGNVENVGEEKFEGKNDEVNEESKDVPTGAEEAKGPEDNDNSDENKNAEANDGEEEGKNDDEAEGDNWQEFDDSAESTLQVTAFYGDLHIWRYVRYRRGRGDRDKSFSGRTPTSSNIKGLAGQQWAKRAFDVVENAEWVYPNPKFATTFFEAYEIFSGAVYVSIFGDDTVNESLDDDNLIVGSRIVVVPPGEVFFYKDNPNKYFNGVLISKDSLTGTIRLDNGQVFARIPRDLLFSVSLVGGQQEWCCTNKLCNQVNDSRSIECLVCRSAFPLHDASRITDFEERSLTNWPIAQELHEESFAFGYISFLCRIYRGFCSTGREIAEFAKDNFQFELQSLLIVVQYLIHAAFDRLSRVPADQRKVAKEFLNQLPAFPYDENARYLHDRGHFTLDHGVGFAFFNRLIAVCNLAINSSLWVTINDEYLSVGRKEPPFEKEMTNSSLNKKPIFSNQKCFKMTCTTIQALTVSPSDHRNKETYTNFQLLTTSRSPLSALETDTDELMLFSNTCRRVLEIIADEKRSSSSEEESEQSSTMSFREIDEKIKRFLNNQVEFLGKDNTAGGILEDIMETDKRKSTEKLIKSKQEFTTTEVANSEGLAQILFGTLPIENCGDAVDWMYKNIVKLLGRIDHKLAGALANLRSHVRNATNKLHKLSSSSSDKIFNLSHMAGRLHRLKVEDIVLGLLSDTVKKDLQKFNPKHSEELYESALEIVFGTILISHVSRCIQQVRTIRAEVNVVLEGLIRLAMCTSNSVNVIERFGSAGLFKRALNIEDKNVDFVSFADALDRARELKENASRLDKDEQASDDKSDGSYSNLDILLRLYNFDVHAVKNEVTDARNDDRYSIEDVVSLATRGLCVKGKHIELEEVSEIKPDMNTYMANLRHSLINQVLLLQHLASGLSGMLKSQHSVMMDSNTFNPQYLVFEFLTGFMLRQDQVEKIEELFQTCIHPRNQSAVHELIMGSGKTACIGPMLCLLLAKGDRAVMQIVPDPLLEQTRDVLAGVFSSVITKRIVVLNFSRSTFDGNDIQPLLTLKKKVDDAKQNGHIILCAPSQVKKLFLKFVDFMTAIRDVNPLVALPPRVLPENIRDHIHDLAKLSVGPMLKKLKIMASILDVFRAADQSRPGNEGTVAIIDECDMIFDPLKSELNFPVGDRTEVELLRGDDWKLSRWEFPMALYGGFFAAISDKEYAPILAATDEQNMWRKALESIRQTVDVGVKQLFLQIKPYVTLLNKKWYYSCLAEPLARWSMIWLSDKLFKFMIPRPLYSEEYENLISWIAGKSKDFPQSLLSGNENNDCRVNTFFQFARKWIVTLIPHNLSKRHGIDYGLLKGKHLDSWQQRHIKAGLNDNRLMLAVPFMGLETPSAFSEFASPDVSIGFTILAYYHDGLRNEDIKVLMSHLRHVMFNSDHGPYRVRKARAKFESWKGESRIWCPNLDATEVARIPPLEHLQTSDENKSILAQVHKILRYQPGAQWEYLDTYVFPKTMKMQKEKLQASGVDIGSSMIFASRIGFSGTPSNLLPLSLRDCKTQPGTRADVVRTLVNPNVVSCEKYSISGVDSTAQLLDCAGSGKFHAMVDNGALITGLTNREIAYELIKRLPVEIFSAVVYIDDAGAKRVLLRGEDPSAPPRALSDVNLPWNRRFTFYDQVHTTGIDIKQAIDAKCLLTIGKGMILRDLMQGAWRMRGIGKGQTICYHTTTDIAQLIRRDLSPSEEPNLENISNPTPVEIVSWLILNQLQVKLLIAFPSVLPLIQHSFRLKSSSS